VRPNQFELAAGEAREDFALRANDLAEMKHLFFHL